MNIPFHDFIANLGSILALERPLPHGELVDDHSQRIEI